MRSRWIAALGLIGLLAGCGGPPAPAPAPPRPTTTAPAAPAPAAPTRPAAPPVAMPKEPEVKPLEPLAYDPKGRRDPFVTLVTAEGTKGLAVAAVKLVGIVHGRQGRLALVEAPDGLGYILKAGDQIGDGRVVDIGRDSLTFSVAARPGLPPTPVVKRLRTE
ncbi:MAG: hypothetical protein HYY64_16425 [Candidatus Rokubacteria bacterium]|nr:hypothetical protein [Candidatus Rokubacteria bacterium]